MTRSAGFRLCYGIGVAAATMAAAGGCSRARAAESASPAVPVVAVAKVARGSVAQSLTIAAEFKPFQEIDVHAKVAGYVRSIGVDVGDRVRTGALLAVLEVPELRDDVQQADASVKRAQEEIHRAEADLAHAQSAHDLAHVGAERLTQVVRLRPHLVAQQDIDEASARDRMTEAQVATAKAALAAAAEQLAAARAIQGKTQTLVGYARITAPFTGVITRRYADTGAMIQAGTSSNTQALPLVRLSQNDVLRLVIPVPESAAARVRLKAPVAVRVASLRKTFPGTVARLADRLDTDTRTMRVEVDVPNPALEIVPGMYAEATLVLDQARDVLTAPMTAIERDTAAAGAAARVWVVDGAHHVAPRDVRLGLEAADRVEVASGLADGDLVVTGNRSQLQAGTLVSPNVMAAEGGGR